MRFAQPEFFYLLTIVPLLVLFYAIQFRRRREALKQLGQIQLINRLARSTVEGRQSIKASLVLAILVSFTLALARPQFGIEAETVKQEGFSVMVVLDVSNSMLAEDVKPNRLSQAKYAIRTLLKKLSNDQIGLVVFAGSAFLQCPLTSDYSMIELFLDGIDTQTVGTQGTAISEALLIAGNSFRENQKGSKAILLITDGENHYKDPAVVASTLATQDIQIYVIGIGTLTGAPIPLRNTNGMVIGHMRDQSGNVVISKLDESILRKVAETSEGLYQITSPGGNEIDLVYDAIVSLEKSELESREFEDYIERYQYILFLGLLLLIVDNIIRDRKILRSP